MHCLWIFVLAVLCSTSHIEAENCFICVHSPELGIMDEGCSAGNVTGVVECSVGCIELYYVDPATNETSLYTRDCGVNFCNSTNSDGIERVTENSLYQNYTEHATCCTGNYCNCNSTVCREEIIRRNSSIEIPDNTTSASNETTTAIAPTTAALTPNVCLYCIHDVLTGSVSPECLNGNTSEMIECNGTCLRISYVDPATNEILLFALDCGSDLCDVTNSDGVERVTVNHFFQNYTEHLTCCVGDYCNNVTSEDSPTTAATNTTQIDTSAAGDDSTTSSEMTTDSIESNVTTGMTTTAGTNFTSREIPVGELTTVYEKSTEFKTTAKSQEDTTATWTPPAASKGDTTTIAKGDETLHENKTSTITTTSTKNPFSSACQTSFQLSTFLFNLLLAFLLLS